MAVLLVRLLLPLLLLPPSSPHDGLRLVLLATQVVPVRQAGSPHHFPGSNKHIVVQCRGWTMWPRNQHHGYCMSNLANFFASNTINVRLFEKEHVKIAHLQAHTTHGYRVPVFKFFLDATIIERSIIIQGLEVNQTNQFSWLLANLFNMFLCNLFRINTNNYIKETTWARLFVQNVFVKLPSRNKWRMLTLSHKSYYNLQ